MDHKRQLHQYPPGIGKSRIIPDIANQLLTHGIIRRVIIFTSHKGLMMRDKDDYEDMLELAGLRASIHYRTSLTEQVEQFDALLFDEADHFMFSFPNRFESLCLRHLVICMSATIPDSSANDLEHAVLQRFRMKTFNYYPSSLPV